MEPFPFTCADGSTVIVYPLTAEQYADWEESLRDDVFPDLFDDGDDDAIDWVI